MANELVKSGRKVLIFVTRIDHGEVLQKMGGGEFLYSLHPKRDELIDSFKDGNIKCLISTSVLNEGFDLPIIDAVILAGPVKSIIMTLQRIGRALRPYPNKSDAIIVDFADNCLFLKDHFQRRFERYILENSWKIEKSIDESSEQTKLDLDW
ncbi:conserved hypothetical protein [Candidatus Desulfosporosinus infrequens]|uniref:Helicase C-terminal domain-containing protein n=1 Tax=Candidatus Desulfosporosinus infrequens TaxID=2043169 RepID=A0A2U3LXB7_9FIRM|nr:conserved hypothetical protein [Candidatus Desulfosporosinus infrequens]